MTDPIQQARETRQRNIGRLTNDQLLKRWEQGGFDEAARPLAEAEIARRGLDTSPAAVARVHHREAGLAHGLVARRRQQRRRQLTIAVILVVAVAVAGKALDLF